MVDLPAEGGAGGDKIMHFIYVLRSKKDSRFYTGITNNLERRIKEHDRGVSSTRSTKNRGPFKLIYFEKAENRKLARAREKYLKSGMGREFIKNRIPTHSGVAQW